MKHKIYSNNYALLFQSILTVLNYKENILHPEQNLDINDNAGLTYQKSPMS